MKKDSKIYLAGHTGLVGSAIRRALQAKGYSNIIHRTSEELDLTNQKATQNFFEKEKPEYVILAAAKVGGILANNTYRADFIYQNLQIQNNVIHNSYLAGVKKLLFLGSSCIYPGKCPQPMQEDHLLTSPLEYTNEPYAIAKIAGMKMCESYNIQYGTNFISTMPTNLYGPGDNFNLETSHVLPAMLRKIHLAKLLEENNKEAIIKDLQAKDWPSVESKLKSYGITRKKLPTDSRPLTTVTLWGSGRPRRELMYSDDLALACVYLIENVNFLDLSAGKKEIRNTHINVGTGIDHSIKEIAEIVKKVVGFNGEIKWDTSKPDGTMLKKLDVSKIKGLGWQAKVALEDGVRRLYGFYLA